LSQRICAGRSPPMGASAASGWAAVEEMPMQFQLTVEVGSPTPRRAYAGVDTGGRRVVANAPWSLPEGEAHRDRRRSDCGVLRAEGVALDGALLASGPRFRSASSVPPARAASATFRGQPAL